MNLFDLALIAVYLAGITLFGLRFRNQQRSPRDYFLAAVSDRRAVRNAGIVAADSLPLVRADR